MEVVNTIGRRKSSVARIFIQKGKGNITVNKKDYKTYFPSSLLQSSRKKNGSISRKNLILRFSPPPETPAAEPFFLRATAITRGGDSSSSVKRNTITTTTSATITKRMIVTFSGEIPATSSTIKSLAKELSNTVTQANTNNDHDDDGDEYYVADDDFSFGEIISP